MIKYDKYDPKSIERHAKSLLNKSLRDILSHETITEVVESEDKKNKGKLGQQIEEFHFDIPPNNRAEADFVEAGVELKTSGLLERGDRLSAKERLVLSMIDYHKLYEESWDNNSLFEKSSLLLLMLYLYDRDALNVDLVFRIISLWEFPERDLIIIKRDWETIYSKVANGLAHEISEGDTYFLGACTKGGSLKTQPCSEKRAKSRAFALKRNYVENVVASCLAKQDDIEPAIKDTSEYQETPSLEEIIYKRFDGYIGKTAAEIASEFNINLSKVSSKDKYATLVRNIIGVKAKKVEEFEKAGIKVKTIRLKKDGTPKEDMSFPCFKYMELIKEKWETSHLRERFSKKFFFVIFQFSEDGSLKLKKVMFWNMPDKDLEVEAKKVWKETIKRIKNGKAHELPKKSESPVSHVRPHARNSRDTYPTPKNGDVVKKCFWLNNHYLKKQINL